MRISDWSSDVCSSDLRRTGDLKGVKTMTHEIRESWLNAVAQGMAPLFEALDAPLPDRVRVAIGFTSRGAKGKAIGECWDNRRSEEHTSELQSLMRISYAVFCLKKKKKDSDVQHAEQHATHSS